MILTEQSIIKEKVIEYHRVIVSYGNGEDMNLVPNNLIVICLINLLQNC